MPQGRPLFVSHSVARQSDSDVAPHVEIRAYPSAGTSKKGLVTVKERPSLAQREKARHEERRGLEGEKGEGRGNVTKETQLSLGRRN